MRFDGGTIVEVVPSTGSAEVDLLAPGFIDLQVNGQGDVDVATADGPGWARLGAALCAHGVTTWCPTLIGAPRPVLDERIARISELAEDVQRHGSRPVPALGGIHLEGPFLGAAHGAHRYVEDEPIDVDWLASLPDTVAVVTLGPERVGAPEAIAVLAERGIVVSLGHTTASYESTVTAIDAGATLFTHLFNAAGAMHHRRPGAVGAALTDDRIAVALIADGVHVHPAVLRMAWRSKPAGRVVLVTDSVAWDSGRLGDAGIEVRDGAPRLADETLAGSTLCMNEAVAYCVESVGVDLHDTLTAAASTPADVLGLDDRGRIAPGRRADLVALDDRFRVEGTWIAGVAADQPGGSGS